jgi:bifunctional non-homologous end joining protein LigD
MTNNDTGRRVTIRVPDPMKAEDLTGQIAWGTPHPFAGLRQWLTFGWIAEPKLDGCRATLVLRDGPARFAGTRAGSFPAFAAIRIPGLAGTVLDGEFMAPPMPGEHHAPHERTAGWFGSGPSRARHYELCYGQPQFHVFDITALAGVDCTGNTYDERRAALEDVVARIQAAYPGCGVVLVPQLPASAKSIEAELAAGGEGVMLKDRASRYVPSVRGSRSRSWAKVKGTGTVDAWLTGGWKPGQGGRAGTVGSVEVAVTGPDGAPVVLGFVSVKPAWAAEVTAADGGLRPEYAGTVIEVMANGITADGLLRHPRMVRVRPDKTPAGCDTAQLSALPGSPAPTATRPRRSA